MFAEMLAELKADSDSTARPAAASSPFPELTDAAATDIRLMHPPTGVPVVANGTTDFPND